jgi:hypothetical protein
MARIRYRKVKAETGEEVPEDNIVKGYEISKGRYVVLDPAELEPFVPAANKVALGRFVMRSPCKGIPPPNAEAQTHIRNGEANDARPRTRTAPSLRRIRSRCCDSSAER